MSTPTRPCPYCGQQVLATATACGYCGRPLPAAPAPQGGLAPPSPGPRPAAGAPAKTMFGYAAPVLPPAGGGAAPKPGAPPAQPMGGPPPAAPPMQQAAPAPMPTFQPAPVPQAPPPQQFAPPAAPPMAPAPQPFQPPPAQQFQAPPAQQFAPPAPQPMAPPPVQQSQPLPAPPPSGAMQMLEGAAGAASAQVRSGKLLGIPFAVLRDQQFEAKVMMISAIALVLTRFFPLGKHGDKLFWTWTPDGGIMFKLMILPLLLGAIYGGATLFRQQVSQFVPASVMRWLPFLGAFLTCGLLGAAMPETIVAAAIGRLPDGFALWLWAFPALAFGIVTLVQNPEDTVARILMVAGAALAVLGTLLEIKGVFHFKGEGFFGVLHNLMFFVVMLVSLGALAYGLGKWVPGFRALDAFAPLMASALIGWPVVSMLIGGLAITHHGKFVDFIFLVPHMLVSLVALFGMLMLMAPEALDALKKALGAQMAMPAQPQQAMGGMGVPPHIAQQLQELDAAWARGGMTPEEYHARRNAILGQR